jgi:hypothetical protein
LRWGEMEDGNNVVRITPQGRMLVSGNALAFEDTLTLGKPLI